MSDKSSKTENQPQCGPHPQLTASDISHLDVLPLLFRIMAVLTFCFASLFLFHFIMGLSGLINPQLMKTEKGEPMPVWFFWTFTLTGGVLVSVGWTFAALVFMAAGWIKERRRHTWITIIAALCCLQTPLGTALGVFTLVVILRPQVKALFSL